MIKPYILKNPIEVEKNFLIRTDKLGMAIDEGIFRSVVILNSLGFVTRQSCEGHPDRFGTYPWIDITFNNPDEDKTVARELFFNTLFKDLVDFYSNRKIIHHIKLTYWEFNEDELQIRICNMVNPNVYQNREEVIEHCKLELNSFCEFLNKKYNLNY
jgi:hypothetical protein